MFTTTNILALITILVTIMIAGYYCFTKVFCESCQYICCHLSCCRRQEYDLLSHIVDTTTSIGSRSVVPSNSVSVVLSNIATPSVSLIHLQAVLGNGRWKHDGDINLSLLEKAIDRYPLGSTLFTIQLVHRCIKGLPVTIGYSGAWSIVRALCERLDAIGSNQYKDPDMSATLDIIYVHIEMVQQQLVVPPSITVTITAEDARKNWSSRFNVTMDNLQKRILSTFVNSVTQTRSKLWNIFDGLLVAYDTLSRSIATSLLRRHDLSLRAQLLVRSSPKYEFLYCNHRIIDMGKIHACFSIPDNLHDQLEQLKTNEGGEINIQYVWDDQSSTFHVHG